MKKIFLPIVLCALMVFSSLLLACTPIGEHEHNLVPVDEVAATCVKDGIRAHNICTICGYWFDDNGNKIDEKDYVIQATGKHDFQDGKCTVCGTPDPTWQGGEDRPDPPVDQLAWLKGEWIEEYDDDPWSLTYDGTTMSVTYAYGGGLTTSIATSLTPVSETKAVFTVNGITAGECSVTKVDDYTIRVTINNESARLTKKTDEPDDPTAEYATGMQQMVEGGFQLTRYTLSGGYYINFISGKQVEIHYTYRDYAYSEEGREINVDGTYNIGKAYLVDPGKSVLWAIKLLNTPTDKDTINWAGYFARENDGTYTWLEKGDYLWPQLADEFITFNNDQFYSSVEKTTAVTLPQEIFAELDGTWNFISDDGMTENQIIVDIATSAINIYHSDCIIVDYFVSQNKAGQDFYMLNFYNSGNSGWIRYNPYDGKLITADLRNVYEHQDPNYATPFKGDLPVDLKGEYKLAAKGTYAVTGKKAVFTPASGDTFNYVITNVEDGASANAKKVTIALATDKTATIEFTYDLVNNTLTSGTDVFVGENLYLMKAEGIPAAIKGTYEYDGDIADWYYAFNAENNYKVTAHEDSGETVDYWVTEYNAETKTLTLKRVIDIETGHKVNINTVADRTRTFVYDETANTLTIKGEKPEYDKVFKESKADREIELPANLNGTYYAEGSKTNYVDILSYKVKFSGFVDNINDEYAISGFDSESGELTLTANGTTATEETVTLTFKDNTIIYNKTTFTEGRPLRFSGEFYDGNGKYVIDDTTVTYIDLAGKETEYIITQESEEPDAKTNRYGWYVILKENAKYGGYAYLWYDYVEDACGDRKYDVYIVAGRKPEYSKTGIPAEIAGTYELKAIMHDHVTYKEYIVTSNIIIDVEEGTVITSDYRYFISRYDESDNTLVCVRAVGVGSGSEIRFSIDKDDPDKIIDRSASYERFYTRELDVSTLPAKLRDGGTYTILDGSLTLVFDMDNLTVTATPSKGEVIYYNFYKYDDGKITLNIIDFYDTALQIKIYYYDEKNDTILLTKEEINLPDGLKNGAAFVGRNETFVFDETAMTLTVTNYRNMSENKAIYNISGYADGVISLELISGTHFTTYSALYYDTERDRLRENKDSGEDKAARMCTPADNFTLTGRFISSDSNQSYTQWVFNGTTSAFYFYTSYGYSDYFIVKEYDAASGKITLFAGPFDEKVLFYHEDEYKIDDNGLAYYLQGHEPKPEMTLPDGMAGKYLDKYYRESYIEISKDLSVKIHIDGKDSTKTVIKVEGNKVTLDISGVLEYNAAEFSITYKTSNDTYIFILEGKYPAEPEEITLPDGLPGDYYFNDMILTFVSGSTDIAVKFADGTQTTYTVISCVIEAKDATLTVDKNDGQGGVLRYYWNHITKKMYMATNHSTTLGSLKPNNALTSIPMKGVYEDLTKTWSYTFYEDGLVVYYNGSSYTQYFVIGYDEDSGKLTYFNCKDGFSYNGGTYNKANNTINNNGTTFIPQGSEQTNILPEGLRNNATFFALSETYVFDDKALTLTYTQYFDSADGNVIIFDITDYTNGLIRLKEKGGSRTETRFFDEETGELKLNKQEETTSIGRVPTTPVDNFTLEGKFVEAESGDAWIFDGTTHVFKVESTMYGQYYVTEFDDASGTITMSAGSSEKTITYDKSLNTITEEVVVEEKPATKTYKLEGAQEQPSFPDLADLKGEYFAIDGKIYTFDGANITAKDIEGNVEHFTITSSTDGTFMYKSVENPGNAEKKWYFYSSDKCLYLSSSKGTVQARPVPETAVKMPELKGSYSNGAKKCVFDGTYHVLSYNTYGDIDKHYCIVSYDDETGNMELLPVDTTVPKYGQFKKATPDKVQIAGTTYTKDEEGPEEPELVVPEVFNGIFVGTSLAYIFDGTAAVKVRKIDGTTEEWEVIEATNEEDNYSVTIKSKSGAGEAVKLDYNTAISDPRLMSNGSAVAWKRVPSKTEMDIPEELYGTWENSSTTIEIAKDGYVVITTSSGSKLYLITRYDSGLDWLFAEMNNTAMIEFHNGTITYSNKSLTKKAGSGEATTVTLPDGMAGKYFDEANQDNYIEVSNDGVKAHIGGADSTYKLSKVEGTTVTLADNNDVIEYNASTYSITYKGVKYIEEKHYQFESQFDFPENFCGKYTYSREGAYIEIRADGTATFSRPTHGVDGEWKVVRWDGKYLYMDKTDGSFTNEVFTWEVDASGNMSLTYGGTKFTKKAA